MGRIRVRLPHLLITLEESALAFATGAAVGLLLGFLLARVRFLEQLFEPFLKMFNALPRVVLAPSSCSGSAWASGRRSRSGSRYVLHRLLQHLEGVKSVDRVLIDNARMLGPANASCSATCSSPAH
ncbi:hypothetical protein [Arthrobacter sp.]|uniref:hypothetical protein n=1 Tax=Arthrobacter sp. TaxID=1667 RepID=UPI003A94DC90